MNKTTLESLEEALERLEQIDGMYSWAHLLYEVREALAEQEKQEPVACHERQWVDLPVACDCGDVYPADSFGAGFIAATGRCQNCDVAAPVSAKREWVDLTEGEQEAIYLKCNTPSEYTNAVIAAFKEKNR